MNKCHGVFVMLLFTSSDWPGKQASIPYSDAVERPFCCCCINTVYSSTAVLYCDIRVGAERGIEGREREERSRSGGKGVLK
jgi:hypothetical protein